jgi:hypothetical protein
LLVVAVPSLLPISAAARGEWQLSGRRRQQVAGPGVAGGRQPYPNPGVQSWEQQNKRLVAWRLSRVACELLDKLRS